MAKRHYLGIVFVQEKLADGSPMFVAHCDTLGIASQGVTIEEASRNVKEAINLYLEECPECVEEIPQTTPTFSCVEVQHDAKIARLIR